MPSPRFRLFNEHDNLLNVPDNNRILYSGDDIDELSKIIASRHGSRTVNVEFDIPPELEAILDSSGEQQYVTLKGSWGEVRRTGRGQLPNQLDYCGGSRDCPYVDNIMVSFQTRENAYPQTDNGILRVYPKLGSDDPGKHRRPAKAHLQIRLIHGTSQATYKEIVELAEQALRDQILNFCVPPSDTPDSKAAA